MDREIISYEDVEPEQPTNGDDNSKLGPDGKKLNEFGKWNGNFVFGSNGPPVSHRASRHLWIGSLDETVLNEEKLKQIFSQFGEVEEVKMFFGKNYGFVDFAHLWEAVKAMREMNHKEIGSMRIVIRFGKHESSSLLWCEINDYITSSELSEFFKQYGTIQEISVHRKRNYALVKFKEKSEAEEAVEANLEGATVEGQSLKVEYYFSPTHKRKRREGESDDGQHGPDSPTVFYFNEEDSPDDRESKRRENFRELSRRPESRDGKFKEGKRENDDQRSTYPMDTQSDLRSSSGSLKIDPRKEISKDPRLRDSRDPRDFGYRDFRDFRDFREAPKDPRAKSDPRIRETPKDPIRENYAPRDPRKEVPPPREPPRRENIVTKEQPRESRIKTLAKEDAWKSEQFRERFPSLRNDPVKDPRTRSDSPIKLEENKTEESWGIPKDLLQSKPETPKSARKENSVESPKDPRRWPAPLMATLKKENSKENVNQEVPIRAPIPTTPTISSLLNPSNEKPTPSPVSISSLVNPSSPTLSPSSIQSLTQLPPRSDSPVKVSPTNPLKLTLSMSNHSLSINSLINPVSMSPKAAPMEISTSPPPVRSSSPVSNTSAPANTSPQMLHRTSSGNVASTANATSGNAANQSAAPLKKRLKQFMQNTD